MKSYGENWKWREEKYGRGLSSYAQEVVKGLAYRPKHTNAEHDAVGIILLIRVINNDHMTWLSLRNP